MKSLLKNIIRTSRLKLVPISLVYKDIIFQEFTPEITAYMYVQPAQHISGIIKFIDESIAKMKKGNCLALVITKKYDNEFLGFIDLRNIDKKTPKIGLWIKKSAHGHKYGREAAQGLKKWVNENLDYKYIIYPVEKENIPSRKVAEMLGGKIAKRYTQKNMSGRMQDMLEYRIYPVKTD